MALTSLSEVKDLLGITPTNTAKDFWIDALRNAAERIIQERIRRRLELQSYTEYYSGTGTRYLTLRQRPVTVVTSVYQDAEGYYDQGISDPFPASSLLVEGKDYILELDEQGLRSRSGILVRINGTWPERGRAYIPGKLWAETTPAQGNIKVVYTAGFDPIPPDIKASVAMLVAFLQKTIPAGGMPLESERIGDYSYTIATKLLIQSHPLVGTLEQILSQYRESGF